ncbi:MAG: DUF6090 family protein [Christiangramia sp.]
MINFFRKTRRRLLLKKKFSKYLLYAIGEITLVVIGILIALAINNWKENQTVLKREQFYLSGLKEEFLDNKIKLQNLMEVNQLNYQNSQKLAILLGENEKLPAEEDLSQMLYHSFSYDLAYNPNNSFLKELINSGRLEDISNPDLRRKLTAWESFFQSLSNQENALRLQREKVVDLFRGNNASIRTILDQSGISSTVLELPPANTNFSNLDIVKTREFENNLLIFVLTGIATEKSQYKPLFKEINIILDLIEKELNPK